METILNNHLLVLLFILSTGYLIGNIKIKGISLGASACLFVAIAAGAAGAGVPQIITSLGVIFFVYSIGLQAGPRFFHLFNRRGIKFSVLAILTVFIGAGTALLLAIPLGISTASAVGIFAGAMTSTPALASSIDALELYLPGKAGEASLGYAIAYPFGLVSEILFVQLMPKIFAKKVKEEKEVEAAAKNRDEFRSHQYRLTNANFVGKTIDEIDLHDLCRVNLTRFKRGEDINLVTPSTRFEMSDVVVAVGTIEELAKFRMIFGDEVSTPLPQHRRHEIRDIYISGKAVVGKALRELRLPDTYGITVTRLYREETMIVPTGEVMLEMGDLIKVVGDSENVERFIKVAGAAKSKLDDTNIMILALGMFLGAAIGEIPIVVGSVTFKLGLAGGPLFVALLLGHFGRIGGVSIRIPNAVKIFIRELGLVFFLTGVGVKTGSELLKTAERHDIINSFLLGAGVSIVAMFASYFIVRRIYRTPICSSLGALCGAKTSSPSLGVLIKALDDDTPTLSYAATYPVAIIMLTVVGQLFVWLGSILLN